MERFVHIPIASAEQLEKERESGPGYRFVSIGLRDGRCFQPAVASEGCIIQVKGYRNLPFTEEEVEFVTITEKRWNFRRRKEERAKAASA
jgi:hypothetical protein